LSTFLQKAPATNMPARSPLLSDFLLLVRLYSFLFLFQDFKFQDFKIQIVNRKSSIVNRQSSIVIVPIVPKVPIVPLTCRLTDLLTILHSSFFILHSSFFILHSRSVVLPLHNRSGRAILVLNTHPN